MKASPEKTRITVVGMGLTGLSCARFFTARNIPFRVVDSRQNPPMKAVFEQEFAGVDMYCGEFTTGFLSGDDTLVVSPGMSLTEPAIARALQEGAILSSDIEIFVQQVNTPIIAITGSNGKSTVTTLVGEILKNAGKKVCVAGNIGVPVLEQVLQQTPFDVFVLELSSFQLERLPNLSALSASILNVTEDHMDRYNGFDDYLAAKQRIFTGATHVVVNRDDLLTNPVDGESHHLLSYGFSVPQQGEFGLRVADGQEWIAFGTELLCTVDELKIKGRHNIANAMAALALVHSTGLPFQPMIATLKSFTGLRHRCEWVDDVNGVHFYNDSKATNVGAAVAAIGGFANTGNLLLIAGGLDKDSDFSPLAKTVREKVSHVFLIGKDADKLEKAIGAGMCTHAPDLPAAVNAAYQAAQAGDVVLLAPACASFDMFKGYEDRGDSFVRAVKGLIP